MKGRYSRLFIFSLVWANKVLVPSHGMLKINISQSGVSKKYAPHEIIV